MNNRYHRIALLDAENTIERIIGTLKVQNAGYAAIARGYLQSELYEITDSQITLWMDLSEIIEKWRERRR